MRTLADLTESDDADIWINTFLQTREVKFRAQLTGAIDNAAGQLEFLKPAVVDPGKWMGPVAMVHRGTLLMIFADAKRVVTVHMLRHPERLRQQVIDDIVALALAELTLRKSEPPSPQGVLHMINYVIKTYGAPVGNTGKYWPPVGTEMFLGYLFGSMPEAARRDIIGSLEEFADKDVCPVMIGLIGPASAGSDKLCGIWPILMPLAKYVEPATGMRLAPPPRHADPH